MLLAAAIAFALASCGAALIGRRSAVRARREARTLRAQLERFDAQIRNTETPRSVDVSDLRREAQFRFVAREAEHYRDLLAHLLADFRDATGAEEAIFWDWNEARDGLVPADWSTEGPKPAFFDAAAWAPLVSWAVEEVEPTQLAVRDGVVLAGAAAVRIGETQLGVLSITNRDGLARSSQELRVWLPRLASQLGYFHELVQVRISYGQHMRQSQALLNAVQRLQADKSGEGLGKSICETAMEVSGARGAALVRWTASSEVAELVYATEGLGLKVPAVLDPRSQTADACRLGYPRVFEDARGRSTAASLYGVGRSMRDPGSVAIVPFVRNGNVLGALVLESDTVEFFTPEAPKPLMVLLAVAAGSIELAWSYQEVDKRSRTDALTGLYNRMHFGEQLQSRLAEADRYEHPLSLVLVDIDHFKQVNDTYGHEAGDAVLRHVSRILQEGVRAVDVCVRYGGEEIALLLPQTGSMEATEVAERLRERIASTAAFHRGAAISVTASFGVATYLELVTDRDQLFPTADAALYLAKADGRNRVRSTSVSKHPTPS
jgi:diguanylate cyclase (GGDEF)-like protein